MSQEQNKDKKTLLQKLKRLMTVTESQIIEEEKARAGADPQENEPGEEIFSTKDKKIKTTTSLLTDDADTGIKPVLKLIEKDQVIAEKEIAPAKASAPLEDKEGAAQIVKDVSTAYEQAKEQQELPANKEKTEEQAKEEEKEAPKTEEPVQAEPVKSEERKEEPAEEESTGEKTHKTAETKAPKTEKKKETEQGYFPKDKDTETAQPLKKPKKYTLVSLIQTAVVFGQALNAKPDEYEQDSFDDEPVLAQRTPPISKNGQIHKDTEEVPTDSQPLPIETAGQAPVQETVKGESLQKIVEENNRITKQNEADNAEKRQKQREKEPKPKAHVSGEEKKFVKTKPVKGSIVIDGDSLPMYGYEDKSPRITVEIGKLSPVLIQEYETYMEPEQLQARKAAEQEKKDPIEVITEATTSFSALGIEEEIPEKEDKGEKLERAEGKEPSSKPKNKKEKQKKTGEQEKLDKTAAETDMPQEQQPKRGLKEKLFGDYREEADYSAFTTPNDEKIETIDDYESPQDAKAVRAEINLNIRRLFFRSLIVGILFVLDLAIFVIQRAVPDMLVSAIPNVDIMFCIVNFLLLIIAVAVSSVTIKNGLSPLWGFRGNSDTAVSVAAIATIMQCIIAFFNSRAFFTGGQNLYTLLVLFALLLNGIGKLWIVLRIKENFKFVSADKRKYVVKIFNDEKTAEEMIAGTNAEEPIIAFQRRTKFLKNFLRLSYAPDPSEKVASKFAPICVTAAVVVAIIHGIVYQSVSGAISSLALVACVGIPVCSLLAVNIPMRMLCKKALKGDSMIVGYPAVKQFCDTSAVMIDSRELYPRTAVELVNVKPFISYNLEQAVLNAAAVMKAANTSMTYVFEDIIRGKNENLPIVESVKYEEGKGLVGWVGGERILVGTRALLMKYGVEPPSLDFEEPYIMDGKQVTYLANAGQLISMFVTAYTPDKRIMQAVKRMDNSGISLVIRTADANITQETIARDFQIHNSSIKILPNSLGNICKDELSLKEEESRAYIATRGKLVSLSRSLVGCIKIKTNINLAIAVQFIAVVLGMIIASVVAILAGVDSLGTLELFLYTLFWAVASIAVPFIQKS